MLCLKKKRLIKLVELVNALIELTVISEQKVLLNYKRCMRKNVAAKVWTQKS